MGLMNQLSRSIKEMVNNIFGFFSRNKKKRRRSRDDEPIRLHRSWEKEDKEPRSRKGKKQLIVVKHKRKIPGLREFNKILAGFLLLVNLIFSQFLLGSIGAGAQPMFLIFLGNSYIIFRYLWGSRKKEGST